MSETGTSIRLAVGRVLMDEKGRRALYEVTASGTPTASTVADSSRLIGTGRFTSQSFQGQSVRGNSGTAVGEKTWATTLAPSTGTLTVSPSFSPTPVAADNFELWMGIDPDDIDRARDRALVEDCTYWRLVPANVLIDGDFLASGVTNWTGSSATPTKFVNAGESRFAESALKVTNSGANGYAGQTYGVDGSDTYVVWALVQATSGTAAFTVVDLTNSNAAISVTNVTNATWAKGDVGIMYGSITIPATCRSISVRLGGTQNTAVSIWQMFCFYKQGTTTLALPPRITGTQRVGTFYNVDGTDYSALVPTPISTQPSVRMVGGDSGPVAWNMSADGGASWPFSWSTATIGGGGIFFDELTNYAALQTSTQYNTVAGRTAGDAATTNCNIQYIKTATIKQLFGNEAKPLVTRGHVFYYTRWDREFQSAHRTYGAARTVRVAEDSPQMASA